MGTGIEFDDKAGQLCRTHTREAKYYRWKGQGVTGKVTNLGREKRSIRLRNSKVLMKLQRHR